VLIRFLGPLVVGDGATPLAPRDRIVLSVLAIRRGGVVGADTVADALWTDRQAPSSWLKVVQGSIVRLRKSLGPAVIETRPGGYCLTVHADDVDGARFERLVARARELLDAGEPDRAMFVAGEALELWRGQALLDLEEWEVGRIEAARLAELRLDAEEIRVDAALQAGRHREVLADAQVLVAQVPVREHRWTQLALAQHRAGRQAEALRTLHRAREVLVRELGLDPGAELVALEGAILRQDPTLAVTEPSPPDDACPYRGLAPYDVDDSEVYFGREPDVALCLEQLRRDGVLALVGASGSGKSSLLRAGLAATLRRDGLEVAVITPGAHPVDALSDVAQTRRPSVLVVDQCEEVVTLCADADERRRFLDALADHAEQSPLIVGLRADRLGDLSAYPSFAVLVDRGFHLLGPMDEERLRIAIEAPARQAGLRLEPGLTDLLVREVLGAPGSLPLLSHALRQTWERREGNALTVAGYAASGGIHGAIAQSAEQVYVALPADRRRMLRDLVMRLVVTSPGAEPVRARVPHRIVAPDPERELLLDALVGARLVTADAGTVELAHEALTRAWPRLREWLEDDIDGQRAWRHLAAAADAWDEMGRPESELYRGVRLARAIEWRARTRPDLNQVEQHFLDASAGLADVERTEAERHARRLAQVNRRLWVFAAAIAVLAVVASVAAIAAGRQSERADREAALARSNELAAHAVASIQDDPTLATLLAVAADASAPTPASMRALHGALAADLTIARWTFRGEVGSLAVDLHRTGDRLVSAGSFDPGGSGWRMDVVDLASGDVEWSLDLSEHGEPSAFLAEPHFTPAGDEVFVGVYWDPASWRRLAPPVDGIDEPDPGLVGAYVWDATTGELTQRIDLGRCGGVVSAVTPTHLLAKTLHGPSDVQRSCAWRDGSVAVELVERRTGSRTVLTTSIGTAWHLGAAMSEDGRFAAFDDADEGELVVVEVATGVEVFRQPGAGVHELSADGGRLLAGDRPLDVWDVERAQRAASFDGPSGPILHARFDPSGRSVYANGDDGPLRQWELGTGREVLSYPDIGTGTISVTPGGLVAVTDPNLQRATVIDTRRRGEVASIDTCDGPVVPATLAVGGPVAAIQVACSSGETTTFLIDPQAERERAAMSERVAGSLALSADGALLLDQESGPVLDGAPSRATPTVRDVASGRTLAELEPLDGASGWSAIESPVFSPDGRHVAAAHDGQVVVWHVASGEVSDSVVVGDGVSVTDLLFTPDSSSLVVASSDRRLTRRELAALDEAVGSDLTIDGSSRVGLVGFVDGGRTLVVVGGFQEGGASALAWLDADRFGLKRSLPSIHEGSVTGFALGPDGSRVATASSDGSVRVWDALTGALVDDLMGDGTTVRGVAFVTGDHLVLAPDHAELHVATLDRAELRDAARSAVTRGFTLSECARFDFGDRCPTLAELFPRPTSVEPAGSFRITWTPGVLAEVATQRVVDSTGDTPPPGSFDELAEQFAGEYTLTFHDGRFDFTRRAGGDVVGCSGTYEVDGSRVSLSDERGELCYPGQFVDATFEVTPGALTLEAAGALAEYPWLIVLTSAPLERLD
jgi:WD40 repeat protein/DNA-binding SARP family transcriptional activator